MTKVKFKSDVFKSSSKFIFYKFFYVLSYTSECLNNYQLNFKKIKKDCKKKACERYENLSKEEKEKKWQYGYKSLSEDEKQKPAEYRKKYRMRKIALL